MNALDTMIAEGKEEKATEVVIAMLKFGKLTNHEIASMASVTEAFVADIQRKHNL